MKYVIITNAGLSLRSPAFLSCSEGFLLWIVTIYLHLQEFFTNSAALQLCGLPLPPKFLTAESGNKQAPQRSGAAVYLSRRGFSPQEGVISCPPQTNTGVILFQDHPR